MRIRTQVLIAVLVSLFALGMGAALVSRSAIGQATHLRDLLLLTGSAGHASELIGAVQRERGRSVGWLTSEAGGEPSAALLEQRAETDADVALALMAARALLRAQEAGGLAPQTLAAHRRHRIGEDKMLREFEVRKLAERAQAAATEIGSVSAETLTMSDDAGRRLAALVPEFDRTAGLVREITAASREESLGAEQIKGALADLDRVAARNARLSDATDATAQSLSSYADTLDAIMRRFSFTGPPIRQGDRAHALARLVWSEVSQAASHPSSPTVEMRRVAAAEGQAQPAPLLRCPAAAFAVRSEARSAGKTA